MPRTIDVELRVQFNIAWPVLTGGYPKPEEALGVLSGRREMGKRSPTIRTSCAVLRVLPAETIGEESQK